MATKSESALSFPASVKVLAIGESVSKTRRVAVGSKEARDLAGVLSKLRNVCNQAVSKVRTETGSNFRVESGICLTDDKAAHLATVAVTRFEDEDDTVDI
jgi:hypothetical protein